MTVEPPLSRRRFLLLGAGLAVTAAGWRAAIDAVRRVPMVPAAARVRQILCRSAWGAADRTGRLRRHRIRRITVHHTAVMLTDNRKAPARLRSFQADHQARGWIDIAYHVGIDRQGNVYRLRSPRGAGDTATDYDPAGHLLVLCDGNFDAQSPSRAQVAALVDVLAWACQKYEVKPRRIKGHRDVAASSCPGDALYAKLPRIRRRVRRRLRNGGVTLERLCGAEGVARIREIEAGTD